MSAYFYRYEDVVYASPLDEFDNRDLTRAPSTPQPADAEGAGPTT